MEGMILTSALLLLALSGVGALTVDIPQELYEHARGDNITLPCTFKPSKLDPPQVIISWSLEGAEANAKEIQILTYFSISKTTNIKSVYEGRVSIDVDVAKGKADLRLSSITLADNKVFECRVLIPGDDEGKPADTARLVVLVAPSKPICEIQGKAEYGQNINLTCVSEEGSPAPTYKWESLDVTKAPRRTADPRTTDRGGILSLFNITKDTSGYYTCTSRNKIRSATCNITLAVTPPSMNIGSTAGIIGGVVAALIILIIVIYCCCRRKKKQEEEYAMGAREEEYHDKEPERNGRADGEEDRRANEESSVRGPPERRDRYEEGSERDRDRQSDYDDRRSDYNDRRSDYDDRRSDYNDRRSDYDDRRSDYNDRRYDDDDRRSDYNDRRYDDDDRRGRPYEDRYDEPNDDRDRPPVPSSKPRRGYDD